MGEQLFKGLLSLLPGVLEGIGPPQGDVEVFDLRGREHGLQRLVFLEQGTRLFVVPDGVFDRKDGHRLFSGLHTVAIGLLPLSRRQRMIR